MEEAEYLFHEVPDVNLPIAALQSLRAAGRSAHARGVELAEELIGAIGGLVTGVVVSADREDQLDRLVDAALTQRRL